MYKIPSQERAPFCCAWEAALQLPCQQLPLQSACRSAALPAQPSLGAHLQIIHSTSSYWRRVWQDHGISQTDKDSSETFP